MGARGTVGYVLGCALALIALMVGVGALPGMALGPQEMLVTLLVVLAVMIVVGVVLRRRARSHRQASE